MNNPITKELREHAADHVRVELLAIADRIDIEHKRRLDDCRRNVRREAVRYMRGVLTDYDKGVRRVRKCDKTEVVRCRNCEYAIDCGRGDDYVCVGFADRRVSGNDYCSNGERRDEVDDGQA